MTRRPLRRLSYAILALASILLGIGLYANRLRLEEVPAAGWTAYAPGHTPPEVYGYGLLSYHAGRWWILAAVVLGVIALLTWTRRRAPEQPESPAREAKERWRRPSRPPARVLFASLLGLGLVAVGIYTDHRRPKTGICTLLRRRGTLDEASVGLQRLCAEPPALFAHDAGRWWILAGLIIVVVLLAAASGRRRVVT